MGKIQDSYRKIAPFMQKHPTYDFSPESLKCKFDFDYRALKALKI